MLLVLTAASLTGIVLTSKPVPHHNASSPLPWYGVAGILACVASVVVLTVLHIRRGVRAPGSRSWPRPAPARPWPAAAGSCRVESGRRHADNEWCRREGCE